MPFKLGNNSVACLIEPSGIVTVNPSTDILAQFCAPPAGGVNVMYSFLFRYTGYIEGAPGPLPYVPATLGSLLVKIPLPAVLV